MKHGFACRGDLSDSKTATDVTIAFDNISEFFKKHMI